MQVESTKDEVATFKSTKADLEKQLDVVNEEFSLAKTQMDAKWTLYQESLEQHDAVSKEFTRLKEHQETKYKEAKELRDLISSQQNGYYENRRFSQSVRCTLSLSLSYHALLAIPRMPLYSTGRTACIYSTMVQISYMYQEHVSRT